MAPTDCIEQLVGQLGTGVTTGWSAPVGITSSLDDGVMFDASLRTGVIRRSHSGGSAMPSAFLHIVQSIGIMKLLYII